MPTVCSLFMVLICVFLSTNALAQNVTTSFNRSVLATNPAAASTRGFAQVSVSQTFKKVDSKMKVDGNAGGVAGEYGEDIKLHSTEIRLTGGHAHTIPELYLGFNEVTKQSSQSGVPEKSDSNMHFIDNFFNIAFRSTPTMGWGFKIYFPNFGFTTTRNATTSSGKKYISKNIYKQQVLGLSLGTTSLLGAGFYFGGFVNGELGN